MFVYNRPNGRREEFPHNINKVFNERLEHGRPWYRSRETRDYEMHTVCEYFDIPWNRLKEMRVSAAFKSSAKHYIENLDTSIIEGQDNWFGMMVLLGVIFSERDMKMYSAKRKKDNDRPVEGIWITSSGLHINSTLVNDKIFDLHGTSEGSGEETEMATQQTKLEVFRKWRKNGWKGVPQEKLIDAVEIMMDSRDFWKSESKEAILRRDSAEDEVGRFEARVQTLIETISSLEVENNHLKFNINDNSSLDNLDKMLQDVSYEDKKSLRRLVLLATHPDKVARLLEDKTDEEKTNYNRLFDILQRKLS